MEKEAATLVQVSRERLGVAGVRLLGWEGAGLPGVVAPTRVAILGTGAAALNQSGDDDAHQPCPQRAVGHLLPLMETKKNN